MSIVAREAVGKARSASWSSGPFATPVLKKIDSVFGGAGHRSADVGPWLTAWRQECIQESCTAHVMEIGNDRTHSDQERAWHSYSSFHSRALEAAIRDMCSRRARESSLSLLKNNQVSETMIILLNTKKLCPIFLWDGPTDEESDYDKKTTKKRQKKEQAVL